jgi:putative ABC transport system permease protein
MPDRSRWTADLRARLATLRLDPAREAEIVEELSLHLDERYAALRRGGADDAEARRVALDELRGPDTLARFMRPLRQSRVPEPIAIGTPPRRFLRDFGQDIRYAARMLRKEPTFAAAAVLTVALGIGANTAIFALVDATLLRPLPFPGAERLVMIWERTERTPRGRVAPLNLLDWRARSRTFEAIGAFIPNVGGMVMTGADGLPDTVPRQWVTAGYFDALGVKPIAGRTFRPSDDAGRVNGVVLSEGFWRSRFNADPGIVGRELRLDGGSWTVLGVAGPEAQLLRTSIWALMRIEGAPAAARSQYGLQAIGRMKAGATFDAAAADLAAVADGLAREFPNTNAGRGVALEPLRDAVVGTELRRTALLFLGVVAFVLVICCANVAGLLVTRATARARELAIRSALGAGRGRVARQLLTESLLVSLAGGALGLAAGAAILAAAPSVIPQAVLPASVALTFDWRVAAFAAATALGSGLLFGLVPAWQATSLASPQVVTAGSRAVTGESRVRSLLVAGQIAISVMLLVGAGLLLRTLLAIERVDRGYRAGSVLTMIVDPPGAQRVPWLPYYETVEREVGAVPGVRGVAWATTLPMGRSYQGPSFVEIAGEQAAMAADRPTADYQIVSPSYFAALDLPIVEGRAFDEHDRLDTVAVCLVNEAFARRYVSGRSPIGLRVAIRPTGSPQTPPVVREIVGVVRQVKGSPNEAEEFVQVYVPLAQDTPGDIFMLVRPASGDAAVLAPSVRSVMGRIDKEQLVSVRGVMTLDEVAGAATARHRFRAVLVAAFAALALSLAAIGLFGVLAFTVERRVRDFGVRRALGATTADVVRHVAAGAGRVIAAGAAAGLGASLVLAQLLATMLFGVEPRDPVTFAAVLAVMIVTSLAAAIGPAWRAARVDPAVALRTE